MERNNRVRMSGARARPTPAQQVETQRRRFAEALGRDDFATAVLAAEAVLRLNPGNRVVMADLAFCLMRQGRHDDALAVYRQLHRTDTGQARANHDWLHGLTEVCGWLGRPDDVRRYGLEAMARDDARWGATPAAVIDTPAPPFDGSRPERNVIAYTLFGASPRYGEAAVANARVAAQLFPQWRCRVYLDDSVPGDVQRRLHEAGAQVIDMSGAAGAGLHPLMWRFLVADDPAVDRFLLRDADALLSEREQAAVQAWTASPCWFHHMRDYFTHTELILAGLWGGCRGALPALRPLIGDWLARQGTLTRFADQMFLRERVWPTLRQSLLGHDDLFGFHHARPFPPHAAVRWHSVGFHVGSNASTQVMQGSSALDDGQWQAWQVLDEHGATVCNYRSQVRAKRWQADLPFLLGEPIAAGRWKVVLVA